MTRPKLIVCIKVTDKTKYRQDTQTSKVTYEKLGATHFT